MEIIVSDPKPSVLFGDISAGTGFKWKDWYYMKIEECTTEGMFKKNAVCLDNGMLANFDPTDGVNLIPMSVTVNG
jgi:hypothetical protein